MHIVFAGGGAPGQWFGGLAVAHQIRAARPRARVTFLGSGKDFESRNATLAGFQYVSLPGRSPDSDSALGAAWRHLTGGMSAQRRARRLLNRWQPDVVVGSSGYAAAPAVRAALAMGTPVLLLEYNATPTRLTNTYASRAAAVSSGFDSILDQLNGVGSVQVVGNPIRAAFARVFRRRLERLTIRKNRDARRTLLVLAGTTGSPTMNESVPKGLYKVRSELANWRVIHQAGNRDRKRTASLYQKLGIPAEVTSYIPDIPRVLLAADVAIARAGAVTLAELAAAGVPSVLLPSAKPEDGHEAANAAVFTAARASRAVLEHDGGGRLDDRLSGVLGEMLTSPAVRTQMSASMSALARPNAASRVATMALDLARQAALQSVA